MTYDAEKNCATWTFPALAEGTLPKGNYRLALVGWGIADTAGQLFDGNKDGVAGDDFAPQKVFKV
jgi:hypothetical protein